MALPLGDLVTPSLRGHDLWTYISLGFIFSVAFVISLYVIYSCYHSARSNNNTGDTEYHRPWTRLNNDISGNQKRNRNSRFVFPLGGATVSPDFSPVSGSLASNASNEGEGETTMAIVQTPTKPTSAITTEKASYLMSSNVMGPILSAIVSSKLPQAKKVYRKSLYASESQHSLNTTSNKSSSSINCDSSAANQAPRNQTINLNDSIDSLPHPPQVALFFSTPSSSEIAQNLGLQTPPPPRTLAGSPTAAAARFWNDPKLSPVTGILPLSPQTSLVSIRSKLGGDDSTTSTPPATPSKIPQPIKKPLLPNVRWGKI